MIQTGLQQQQTSCCCYFSNKKGSSNSKRTPKAHNRPMSAGSSGTSGRHGRGRGGNGARPSSTQRTPSLSSSSLSLSPKDTTSRRADQANRDQAPPLFLFPTASRNVFVAKIAMILSGLDHSSLFEGVVRLQQQQQHQHAQQQQQAQRQHRQHKSSSSATSGGSGAVAGGIVVIPPFFRHGHFEAVAAKEVLQKTTTTTTTTNQSSDNGSGGWAVPEVAFLGRSNVGKSSLINGLMRTNLAVTSKHPGRTQQPYYYGLVPDHDREQATSSSSVAVAARGYFVDLPGYGYAIGPDHAIEQWQKQTQQFLLHRHEAGTLKRLFLLQDARVGPLPFDISIQAWFEEAGIPYSVILTKADGVSPPLVIKHVNHLCMRYHHEYTAKEQAFMEDGESYPTLMSPVVHVTSARTGSGMSELLHSVEAAFLEGSIVDPGISDEQP